MLASGYHEVEVVEAVLSEAALISVINTRRSRVTIAHHAAVLSSEALKMYVNFENRKVDSK
jgi:hypothetical protein